MKIPFIDYILYKKFFKEEAQDDNTQNVLPKKIKTTSRSSTIIKKFIGKTISVHNGKATDRITIIPGMVGQKLGAFVLTKKLGKSIHNSIHNRKVKEKARRKITQKKVRKTTKMPKNKSKTSSKKKK